MIHCSGRQSVIKLVIFTRQIKTDNHIALVQTDVFQAKSLFRFH